jgi:hypothetical protein
MSEQNLTAFEKATCEQLVSYKIARLDKETDEQLEARIEQKTSCPKLVDEAKAMVANWNNKREEMGLAIWG